eukprot:CAMPEP_0172760726 /NCGR_PEP_ID=MMETSP1074-20121228/170187_1 /TAXON_ID=2916 /ORGANISM="Ceratium fusus, Strain PA161109" /LENGTH=41 /DNA_ID= /DNA_START= /DNA_END= /DNA_ORIENTATION=
MRGSKYASVLPEPVGAMPMKSRSSATKQEGIVCSAAGDCCC